MWELSPSQASFHSLSKVTLLMTRVESVAFHGAEGKGWEGRASFFHKFTTLYFPPSGIKDLWSWGKTDNKKKQLIICKCPNSVHLESIVEKEEKLINWRSAKQVLGSQFFSSAFTSFFSSSFFSVSFLSSSSFPSEALSFTESSSSFSATLFALSVLPATNSEMCG